MDIQEILRRHNDVKQKIPDIHMYLYQEENVIFLWPKMGCLCVKCCRSSTWFAIVMSMMSQFRGGKRTNSIVSVDQVEESSEKVCIVCNIWPSINNNYSFVSLNKGEFFYNSMVTPRAVQLITCMQSSMRSFHSKKHEHLSKAPTIMIWDGRLVYKHIAFLHSYLIPTL